MRVIILLLASTGIRVGAVPFIKLGDLKNAKLTVYENSSEQYFTFITPECKKAIGSYLDMRERYGEKLINDSFLIREQFDVRCPVNPKPKQIEKAALQYKIFDLCNRAGIDKKDVAVAHGFRRFFMTQLVNSKINPEIREMLLGHRIALAGCYYKPTEEEMYAEYEKAIDNLTINEENRLHNRMKLLEAEKNQIELLELKHEKQISELNQKNKDSEYIIRGKLEEMRKELEPLLELKAILVKEGILREIINSNHSLLTST